MIPFISSHKKKKNFFPLNRKDRETPKSLYSKILGKDQKILK